jgi:hypothetical protein
MLDRVRAEVDELHSWHGGGVAFGRKPFLGELKRAQFRVRPLSFRRDGAVTFLVGEVAMSEGGTLLTYRIEPPVGFVRSLPLTALAPAVLFGVGGYFAAPVLVGDGRMALVALIACCALAGLVFAAALIAYVLYALRQDTARLLSFLASLDRVD